MWNGNWRDRKENKYNKNVIEDEFYTIIFFLTEGVIGSAKNELEDPFKHKKKINIKWKK